MSKKIEFEKLAANIELTLNSNSCKTISIFNTNYKNNKLGIISNITKELKNMGQKVLLINTIYNKDSVKGDTLFINSIEEVPQVFKKIVSTENSTELKIIDLQIKREALDAVLNVLLPALKLDYDRIIISVDTPLESAESRIICSLTDATLMLIDQSTTLRSEIRKTISLLKLANANFIGYVICK